MSVARRTGLTALVASCALAGVLFWASAPALAAKGVVGYFGGTGTAGGLFSTPGGAAVNDTSGNVYVVDSGNNRVQEFTAGGAFIRAWGVGVVTAGAAGTGTLTDSSDEVTAVVTTSKVFLVGQTVTGAGIPAGTTITRVGTGTITLSQATTATAAGSGVALAVTAGAGNVPVNEQQTVTLGSKTTGGTFTLTFSTPNPSPTSDETAAIYYNAPATGAGSVQEALEGLPNIGAGNVAVTGSAGGPWTVEFTGTRFADTDVAQMTAKATGLTVSSGAKTATVATLREGAVALEVCSEAVSCLKGVASAAAGGMSTPEGIAAIEQAFGDVYVTDQGNHRVDEFTEDGEFVRMFGEEVNKTNKTNVCSEEEVENEKEPVECQSGKSGAAAGEFGASIGYPAVDPSTGDVYVADPANRRVDVFKADGVFEQAFGWGVATGAGEFQVCTSTCQAGVASSSEIDLGRFATGSPTRVALDASGEVYVVDGGAPDFRVQKFSSIAKKNAPLAEFFASAYLTGSSSATAPTDVAVEPTLGNVLAARESASPAEHLVYELGAGGALLETYAAGAALPAPNGLAVGPSDTSVYFSTATGNRVFVLGAIVAPTATVEAASGLTASEATLRGTVNPHESPPNGIETAWQFEYSTNQTEWVKAPAGKVAASTSPVAVSQTITGLEAGTVYYVRLRAEKEYAAGSATSATAQFTTVAAAPVVSEESVLNVADASATFTAQVNPEHLATTYHFEYDTAPYTTEAAHGASIPVPGGEVGEGLSEVAVSQEPQNLRPGTTYHYRVVAANAAGVTDGPEQTFTTQPPGASLQLPDGRAWELVSPSDKHGAQIQALGGAHLGVVQAALDGGAVTYLASSPTESEPPGYFSNVQVLSRRGPAGWSSVDITTPNEHQTAFEQTAEYQFFSSDLSSALVNPVNDDSLLLSTRASSQTPYIRSQALCEQQATAAECYLPLFTAKAPYADVPPGTEFGVKYGGYDSLTDYTNALQLEGASPDLGVVVVDSKAVLTETPMDGNSQLYAWFAGRAPDDAVELVSQLPESEGGGPSSEGDSVGSGDFSSSWSGGNNAISRDGSRIFWQTHKGNISGLYMRDTTKKETIRLDVQQPGVSGGEPEAVFEIANSDGSRVFFRDRQRLTANAGQGDRYATAGGDLYECEIVEEAGRDKCDLTDITPEYEGQSAEVRNLVLGASEDGSYVYFVANGVLAEGATPGSCTEGGEASVTCNLYVAHEEDGRWTTKFIAALSIEDDSDWSYETVGHYLEGITARVSPNGRYLAFMSSRSLTGYDNLDARSGKPDQEVYLYDAQAPPGTPSLVCVSCNPTGARPAGVETEQVAVVTQSDVADVAKPPSGKASSWVAANLPGGTPIAVATALSQSRLLFDSGRLFFNSSDALVPQDIDGTEDVYEYEPPGVGSCETSSVTYGASSGGCVGLISSGTSPVESGFLEASENGENAFFLTDERLVGQDTDTAYDVYDARVCTTGEPCLSGPVSPPECTTAEACRAAPAPQPEIFGAPPSQTYSGAGDLTPASAPAASVKAKALTRAQKLAKALKACKKQAKKKRAACERRARARYGAKAKAKQKSEARAKKTSRRGGR